MTDRFHPTNLTAGLKGNRPLKALYADRDRLPWFLRPLFDMLTGLPAPGSAAPAFHPLRALAADLALLAGFATLAAVTATIAAGGTLPVLFGLVSLYAALGTTGRMRRLVVGHLHEAGHGVVTTHLVEEGWSKANAKRATHLIQEIASIVTLTQNGADYSAAHAVHHDKQLGTERDPDGADLKADGLWTSRFRTRGAFYRALMGTVVNPLWHGRKMAARLHGALFRGSMRRRLVALGMLMTLAGSAALMPLPAWLMGIALPWTVGYHIASLLQTLTKHSYGHEEDARDYADQARRCHERIPYHLMPKGEQSTPMAWLIWGLRLALIDIPARLAVLDRSMIGHGWHHMAWPAKRPFNDWTNTVYRMMIYRTEADADDTMATIVLLGLDAALERQARFQSRSQQH